MGDAAWPSWPARVAARERGDARAALPPPPAPRNGVLVLDAAAHPCASCLPGGLLAGVAGPLHYLDLGGVSAASLAEFGLPAAALAGVVKAYCCGSGLTSLDGVGPPAALRYLYLDGNALPEAALLALAAAPWARTLEALDVRGNPGCTPAACAALRAALAPGAFLNGARGEALRLPEAG
jgi:hypothetical protein